MKMIYVLAMLAFSATAFSGCKKDPLAVNDLCTHLQAGEWESAGEDIQKQAQSLADSDWEANIEAMEGWLANQPCVTSAEAFHNIIETLPEQTEVRIRFKGASGAQEERTIDFFFYEDGTLAFNRFHE